MGNTCILVALFIMARGCENTAAMDFLDWLFKYIESEY